MPPKRRSQGAAAQTPTQTTPRRARATVKTRSSTRREIAANSSSSPVPSTAPSTAPSIIAGDDDDDDDDDGGDNATLHGRDDDRHDGDRGESVDNDNDKSKHKHKHKEKGKRKEIHEERRSFEEGPELDKWGFESLSINRQTVARLKRYANRSRTDFTEGPAYALLSTILFAGLRFGLMHASAAVVDHGDWMTRILLPTWKTGVICLANITEFMLIWWNKSTSSQAACIVGLSHMPYYSLLIDFYNIRPTTVIVLAICGMLSIAIPCTRRPPYEVDRSRFSGVTSFLTTSVTVVNLYTVGLYVAYRTFLPQLFEDLFSDVPDKSIFKEGGYSLFFFLMRRMLFAGLFARYLFLVGPLAHAKHMERMGKGEGVAADEMSPKELASLSSYQRWLSSLTHRGRKLLYSVLVVAISLIVNTTAELSLTLPGIKWYGAALYSWVFVMPTIAIGAWSTKPHTTDFKLRRASLPAPAAAEVQENAIDDDDDVNDNDDDDDAYDNDDHDDN